MLPRWKGNSSEAIKIPSVCYHLQQKLAPWSYLNPCKSSEHLLWWIQTTLDFSIKWSTSMSWMFFHQLAKEQDPSTSKSNWLLFFFQQRPKEKEQKSWLLPFARWWRVRGWGNGGCLQCFLQLFTQITKSVLVLLPYCMYTLQMKWEVGGPWIMVNKESEHGLVSGKLWHLLYAQQYINMLLHLVIIALWWHSHLHGK